MTQPLVLSRERGSITVTPAALGRLVVRAAESAGGARVRRPRRGLDIEHDGACAQVGLELAAPHGAVLPELALGVQERVAEALRTMCGLEIDGVDVSVEELDD